MVHTNNLWSRFYHVFLCSLVGLHWGDKFLYTPYLITPIFLVEHLNAGVPPEPLIQFP
jgi:hypothetical protein